MRETRRRHCILLALSVATALVWTVPARAITILNPGFEDRVIATSGGFALNDIPNWNPSGQNATFRPTTGAGGQFPGGVPDPVNVAALGNTQGLGAIFQVLSDTLQANTSYTLTYSAGHRADFAFTSYMVALSAGPSGGPFVTLASKVGITDPGAGKFLTDSITFLGSPTVLSSQFLRIDFSSIFNPATPGQVDIDKVSLDASAVPEPGTLLLLGSGMMAGGIWGQRALRKREKYTRSPRANRQTALLA